MVDKSWGLSTVAEMFVKLRNGLNEGVNFIKNFDMHDVNKAYEEIERKYAKALQFKSVFYKNPARMPPNSLGGGCHLG